MSDSNIGIITLLVLCCGFPLLLFVIFVKLILRFSPSRKLLKFSTYYDFLTIRGLTAIIISIVIILIGYFVPNPFGALLSLGVFLLMLIGVSLIITLVFKLLVELRKKEIDIVLSNDTYYADQPLKISRVFVPVLSTLVYFFPAKLEIYVPERLGSSLRFELNRAFFKQPEIYLPRSKRGRYEIGPMLFTFNDFFGFVQTHVYVNQIKTIYILPHYENVQKLNQKMLNKSYKEFKQLRTIINDDNYYDIREYSPQDDIRKINWKLSARQEEKLLVRRPESINLYIQDKITLFIDNSRVRNIPVVNDSGNRIMYRANTSGDQSSALVDMMEDVLDHQVSAAATVAHFYIKNGSKVTIAYILGGGLRVVDLSNSHDVLKELCYVRYDAFASQNVSAGSLQVVQRKQIVQLNHQGQSQTQGLEALQDKGGIILVNNSLSGPYYKNYFGQQANTLAMTITVDVVSYLAYTTIVKKKRNYKWALFTPEYFHVKSKNTGISEQVADLIRRSSFMPDPNTIIIRSGQGLSSALAQP